MTEETSSELLTSYSNPNYSHVSSLLTASSAEEDEESSLVLMKSDEDDDERDSSALTALADAIHSLELLTKDQEEQQVNGREQMECSLSDSAFSSPLSDVSPVHKIHAPSIQASSTMAISEDAQNNNESALEHTETNESIEKSAGDDDDDDDDDATPKADQTIVDVLAEDDNVDAINKEDGANDNDGGNDGDNGGGGGNGGGDGGGDGGGEDGDQPVSKHSPSGHSTNVTNSDPQHLQHEYATASSNNTNNKNTNNNNSNSNSNSTPNSNNTNTPSNNNSTPNSNNNSSPSNNDHDTPTKNNVSSHSTGENKITSNNKGNENGAELLSPGWERCEDATGAYYWHVKTGTIQRNLPSHSSDLRTKPNEPDVVAETKGGGDADAKTATVTSQKNNTATRQPEASTLNITIIQQQQQQQQQQRLLQQQQQQHTSAAAHENMELPLRFAVRSLGWVLVNEEDLTREKSSQTVNKCIVDLSVGGKKNLTDSIGKWGDGKYLYMDIDQSYLSLIDPIDLTVLNTQAIKTLRVWGVGRENARDFAYVARDKVSRAFTCHVFRCDQPARHIASCLCHLCKLAVSKKNSASSLNRPNKLPQLDTESMPGEVLAKYEDLLRNSSFPTPMDEPKKVLHCHYLGDILVSMPTGIEVLNGAIDTLRKRTPAEKWKYVDVTIAPSTITIVEHEIPDVVVAESRVRFLSFLGISLTDAKLCAYIMHTAQDNFQAHVFYCEPSAGPLCKTIEAACKLRFQKCLDRKGLAATEDQAFENQAGKHTIKFDIAEPLNHIPQRDHSPNSSSSSSSSSSLLPSRETLSNATRQVTRTLERRAAQVAEAVQTGGLVVREGLSSGVVALRHNLSSTHLLKHTIQPSVLVAKQRGMQGLSSTVNFLCRNAKLLAASYSSYSGRNDAEEEEDDRKRGERGEKGGGGDANKMAYNRLAGTSSECDSCYGDDKANGEFIDDDIINYACHPAHQSTAHAAAAADDDDDDDDDEDDDDDDEPDEDDDDDDVKDDGVITGKGKVDDEGNRLDKYYRGGVALRRSE